MPEKPEEISQVRESRSPTQFFDPLSGSWPTVLVDLAVVVVLASIAKLISDGFSGIPARWFLFIAISAVLVFVVVAIPLRVLLLKERKTAVQNIEALHKQNERQHFDTRFSRALDMADIEADALAVTARALPLCAADTSTTILIADNSDAHLQTVAATEGAIADSICDVAGPRQCPAIRYGHTLNFDNSGQLDCCPNLVGRGDGTLAALCVPVSIVGRATGVFHAVRQNVPFTAEERDQMISVAHLAGQRVGMLRATEQSLLQASTDPLTGLANRRSLENSVRALHQDRIPYAVAMCDLDFFKTINDTYGHETGDRALRVFARTLRNSVRPRDLVSRHGGEEFVVVLPNADREFAATVLDRVRMELAIALSDGRTPPFTVSAGIADTGEADDLQGLLTIADERLMAAKKAGRNRVLSSSETPAIEHA